MLATPILPLDSIAAVDETAQIETTLTEGLRTLQLEGIKVPREVAEGAAVPLDLYIGGAA